MIEIVVYRELIAEILQYAKNEFQSFENCIGKILTTFFKINLSFMIFAIKYETLTAEIYVFMLVISLV